MLNRTYTIRAADRSDAGRLAQLVNYAGEGLPLHYWGTIAAAGEDPWLIGRERAARDTGAFSWRNATVAECGGEVAACLVTYVIDTPPPQPDYSAMPSMFVPIQQLEDMAAGSHYVSVLAAYPQFRGRALGTALLDLAEREADGRVLSLVVADNNTGAMRLYERHGYRRHATQPMIKDGWRPAGENWVLMLK